MVRGMRSGVADDFNKSAYKNRTERKARREEKYEEDDVLINHICKVLENWKAYYSPCLHSKAGYLNLFFRKSSSDHQRLRRSL